MQEILLFIMSYVLVFVLYQIFVVSKAKKKMASKKKDKWYPIEVNYLVKKYNLDLEKVNYNQLLQLIAITSSLDIALSVNFMLLLKNFLIEVIGGFIFIIVIILVSYHSIYLFYKRKGMIKNERDK